MCSMFADIYKQQNKWTKYERFAKWNDSMCDWLNSNESNGEDHWLKWNMCRKRERENEIKLNKWQKKKEETQHIYNELLATWIISESIKRQIKSRPSHKQKYYCA